MRGEVDPRLVSFLQASMGFMDALRDIGADGPTVRLSRDAGLRLLELVTCANDLKSEEWSQRDRPHNDGVNSLKIAGVTFEWPKPSVRSECFIASDRTLGEASNDNGRGVLTRFSFDEETPAQR